MEDLTGKADAPGGSETQITAAEWNPFIQEFKNFLNDQFVTMSVGDANQMSKANAMFAARVNFQTCAGVADAYTTTVLSGMRSPGSYQQGIVLIIRPNANNTGASTINMTGEGVKPILREDLSALQAGDLVTTRDAILRYDTASGGRFLLNNASLGAPQQALPKGWIRNLTMGRNATDLTHDVAITIGECRDEANTQNMVLSAILTKQFDAAVAEGNNTGGYPSATLGASTANTDYRFFLVRNTDGTIDAGWDSVANDDASALLTDLNAIRSGWVEYRQLGWSRTSASTTVLLELMNHDEDPSLFRWQETDYIVDNIVTPKVQTALAIPGCPPGAIARLLISLEDDTGGIQNENYGFVLDKESGDPAPTRAAHNVGRTCVHLSTMDIISDIVEVKVDASKEIFHRWSAVGTSPENELFVKCTSFRWNR